MKILMLLLLVLSVCANAKSYKTRHYKEHHAKGLKRDHKKHAEFKKNHLHTMSEASVPGKMDLTPRVSPPEDQGQCGACWDFSITKSARSALMLMDKDPGVLAFNYLLNNCGPGTHEYGCNGGDFQAGDNFLNGHGPWLESQDPYEAKEGRCKNLAPVATEASWVLVGDGSNPPSFKDLASAIAQNHMLSIDVAAGSGDWASYAGGIYNGNGSGIDHMINMVGYDCETSVDALGNCVFDSKGMPIKGDGYLKVMNNWGTSWGEDGYMRTRWGANQIAETAMYFVISDIPPLPSVPVCKGFLCSHFNCELPWC